MKASKITHKNELRIKVDAPYNRESIALLKQIADARWSKTIKAWHIPYTQAAFKQLKALYPNVEYPVAKRDIQEDAGKLTGANLPLVNPQNTIVIDVTGRQILLKMPKNNTDIHFVLSLRFARWDKKSFCWVIPHYPGNLELLKDYFKERLSQITVHKTFEVMSATDQKRTLAMDEVLMIKTTSGRLKVIFGYNKVLMQKIKSFPLHQWNVQNKWWSIPYNDVWLQSIREVAGEQQMQVIYEEEQADETKKDRITPFDIPNYRSCPTEYLLKLRELRYSERTVKNYGSMFEEFINYYHTYEMERIIEPQIVAFMRYLVMERRVSSSYQNQAINAIKFYYERVLGGQRKIYTLDRPRIEKTMPEVLSEKEVADLLRVTDNLKHKCILMVIYSGGLRLSEVINLQLKDIDSDRMQIRIEQGKGKKDRYTLLSPKLLVLLRTYFVNYKPKVWLFEGPVAGTNYSASSVQVIFREAVRKAGIRKKVTVHTLRHSFATHLLEGGVDLRYIQTLLGHESSKTTEIYTHITTKGFDQIKSPLDKLDIF